MNQLATTKLANLAEQINAEHGACEASIRRSLQHALKCGELLTEAKSHVPHGAWGDWVKANFRGSQRTAQGYMRLADRWPEIEAKAQHAADLSCREALLLLSDQRRHESNSTIVALATTSSPSIPFTPSPVSSYANWWDLLARDVLYLDACGATSAEIAATLGVDEQFDVIPVLSPVIRDDRPPRTRAATAAFVHAAMVHHYESAARLAGQLKDHEVQKDLEACARLAWRKSHAADWSSDLDEFFPTVFDDARRALGIERS